MDSPIKRRLGNVYPPASAFRVKHFIDWWSVFIWSLLTAFMTLNGAGLVALAYYAYHHFSH